MSDSAKDEVSVDDHGTGLGVDEWDSCKEEYCRGLSLESECSQKGSPSSLELSQGQRPGGLEPNPRSAKEAGLETPSLWPSVQKAHRSNRTDTASS